MGTAVKKTITLDNGLDVFTLKSGKRVVVDFLSLKSVMAVSVAEWKEISEILQARIDFTKSDKFGQWIYNNLFTGTFPCQYPVKGGIYEPSLQKIN